MWKPSHLQDISLTHGTSADNKVSQTLIFLKAYACFVCYILFCLEIVTLEYFTSSYKESCLQ